MRLTASNFVSYQRPTPCDLRVFLRHRNEEEIAPSPYDEVLHRLGLKHEKEHLATLGTFADMSDASLQRAGEENGGRHRQETSHLVPSRFSCDRKDWRS
jgi:hypothetical protein